MRHLRIMMMHHAAEVYNPDPYETKEYMNQGVGLFGAYSEQFFLRDRHSIRAAFRAFGELPELTRPSFGMSDQFYEFLAEEKEELRSQEKIFPGVETTPLKKVKACLKKQFYKQVIK